jgi:ribosomal protein S18 acetylase RimI-like enzyme
MTVVAVREADKADLPAILRLYAQPEIDDGAVLCAEEAQRLFRRFADYPDYRLFVAVDGGRVIGSYTLLIMDNLGHFGAPSAVIEAVVVDPAAQGAGVGTAMMRHALAEARAKGCYKASLSTNAKRERAHAFYESLGFRRHGYSFFVELEGAA